MSTMQLAYFPYLMLRDFEEIIHGNVRVWNFKKKAMEYIPDETLRNKVTALLSINKYGNSVIEDMGILSIGDRDFRQATDVDIAIAREIKLLLFLSWIAQNNVRRHDANAGHFIATSENFDLSYQNFQLESDLIGESAGYIVTNQVWGYRINETSFNAPSYVLRPLSVSFDDNLRVSLKQLKAEDEALYKRILRATDLLFESYYNNPNVSLNARILLQAGAFEVLMGGQRRRLKEIVESKTILPSDPVVTYSFEKSRNTQTETKSIKVKWADRFYTLRNHIIHGDEVPDSEFLFESQRHTDIAPMFFVLLTKIRLNERFGGTIFNDKIIWGRFNDRNGVNLSNTIFVHAHLAKIGSDTQHTNVSGVNFTNADFTNADLGEPFDFNSYNNDDFTGANLTGVTFTGGPINGSNSNPGTTMVNSNFTNANFTNANLNGSGFSGNTFTGTIWSNTTCPDGTNSNNDGNTCIGHLNGQ